MSRPLSDEMFDARLVGYLNDRAEGAAARARTPEQVAAEITTRVRPSHRVGSETVRVGRLALLIAIVALVVALLTALFAGNRLPSLFPTRPVTIAIELPLDGNGSVAAPIVNGILLAVNDQHGQAGRFRIDIPGSSILSDVASGFPDASQGASNMRQIVADPDSVAVIGPYNSSVARAQMPISHAAGLFQCSPATTDPQLTRAADGEIQAAPSPAPRGANYVRVVSTDDAAAAAAARYVFERLGRTSVYVVDDGQLDGKAMADWFGTEFARIGGGVVGRASLPDSAAALRAMLGAAVATKPQGIYFGGTGDRGATLVKAAAQAGLGEIPFVGTDALNDGSAATNGSFLGLAGDDARHAYSVFPGSGGGPGFADFEARYRAAYGAEPTPFAAAGYACAQIVIAALHRVDADPLPRGVSLRDAVRAAGVDTSTTFDTILGQIAFDARGDVSRPFAAVYAYDTKVRAWVFADQVEPAPGFEK